MPRSSPRRSAAIAATRSPLDREGLVRLERQSRSEIRLAERYGALDLDRAHVELVAFDHRERHAVVVRRLVEARLRIADGGADESHGRVPEPENLLQPRTLRREEIVERRR
jgi:hypothetical protein